MTTPNEQQLLSELDKLEKGLIAKGGDALQNTPHDGGFATQGTNIQAKAKNVKKALKALTKGGMSEDAAKALLKALAGDDDASSPADDSMSPDDESADEDNESPDGDGAAAPQPPVDLKKGASQLANATSSRTQREESIRKALSDEGHGAVVDAVPVLGRLIDSIEALAKSASKSNDNELRKSVKAMRDEQTQFNQKVAKALTIMSASMSNMNDLVKAIADEPAPRRGNTMQKSQFADPSFHDGGTGQLGGPQSPTESSPLMSVEMLKIQETLVDMCMKGQVEVLDITKFENSKGNLNLLPPNVLKQLEQRLCPAS